MTLPFGDEEISPILEGKDRSWSQIEGVTRRWRHLAASSCTGIAKAAMMTNDSRKVMADRFFIELGCISS